MPTELASAYVTLIPSLKGAAAQIQAQLGDINLDKSGQTMGQKLTSGLGKSVTSFGKVATSVLGSIGGAIGQMAASGGISRALNIQQAQTMFKGLQLDWEQYKDTISDAVQGTAFGMDEAALVAANLAASGIGAGDEITKALNGAVGVSATFGASLSDIGGIFQKVAAQGKVTGENLYQMSARGINGVATLSQYLGKTQEEVSQMVSSGQIDFQTFSEAMYAAFGESAKGANETFTGSLTNMKAALSRLGQGFATPVIENMPKVFVSVKNAIDAVSNSLSPLKDRFKFFTELFTSGLSEKIDSFTGKVGEFLKELEDGSKVLKDGVSPIKAIFSGLVEALGPVGGVVAAVAGGIVGLGAAFGALSSVLGAIPGVSMFIGALSGGAGTLGVFTGAVNLLKGVLTGIPSLFNNIVSVLGAARNGFMALQVATAMSGGGIKGLVTVIGSMMGPIGIAVAAAAALAAAFVYLWTTNEQFRASMTAIGQELMAQLQPALASIMAALQQMAAALLPVLTSFIQMMAPLLAQLITTLAQLAAAVLPVVMQVLATLIPLLAQVLAVIINVATQLIAAVMPIITQIVDFITAAMPTIQAVVEAAMNAILAVVQAVWPLIQTIIETAMNIIQSIINVVMAVIQGDWQGAWEAMGQLVNAIWQGIQNIISAAIDFVGSIISAGLDLISSVWNSCWEAISQFLQSAWEGICNAVSSAIDSVVSFMSGLQGQIMGALSGIGSWLFQAGCDLIQGLINGIGSMVDTVISTVAGIANSVVSTVMGIFGEHSPSKVFHKIGVYLFKGLNNGVDEEAGESIETVSTVADSIVDAMWDRASEGGSYVGTTLVEYVAEAIDETSDVAIEATEELTDVIVEETEEAVDEFAAYMDQMIATINSRSHEFKQATGLIADYLWGVEMPAYLAADWVRPATGAVYDSMKELERAGYTLDSFKNKMESIKPDDEDYNDWIALNERLTASFEDLEQFQGLYALKDNVITNINEAETLDLTYQKLAGRLGNVNFSKAFIEGTKSVDGFSDGLANLADMSDEAIQEMVDSYNDLSRVQRLAEIDSRSLWVNSLKYTQEGVRGSIDWLLDLREMCLDVKEAVYSDKGLSAAFDRGGVSVEGFALDLQSLDLTMDDFVSNFNSYVDAVSNGFSQMTKYNQTSLDDWSKNLKLNIAESQAWADNVRKVFEKLGQTGVNSEEFRKAVYQGGFSQWGAVMADMAELNASEIAAYVRLYNDAVTEGQLAALDTFQAISPGEELMEALAAGVLNGSPDVTDAMGDVSEAAVSEALSYYGEFYDAGSDLAEGIGKGIESKINVIAEAAANTVTAAIDAAKAAADIHSPSLIANKEIGQMISLGAAEGITKAAYKVEDAMDRMVHDAISSGAIYADESWKNFNVPGTANGATYQGGTTIINARVSNMQDWDKVATKVSSKQNRDLKACGIL